jgi:hypothetical protein
MSRSIIKTIDNNNNNNKPTILLLDGGPGVPDAMLPIAQGMQNYYHVVLIRATRDWNLGN